MSFDVAAACSSNPESDHYSTVGRMHDIPSSDNDNEESGPEKAASHRHSTGAGGGVLGAVRQQLSRVWTGNRLNELDT